jgi:epsilon-lactone hydrolase
MMNNWRISLTMLFVWLLSLPQISLRAQEARFQAGPGLSEPWTEWFKTRQDPCLIPAFPDPEDTLAWKKIQTGAEQSGLKRSLAMQSKLNPLISDSVWNGQRITNIYPNKGCLQGKVMIYMHGGAFTLLSAASSLNIACLMAERTGLRLVSVDYPLAPGGNYYSMSGALLIVWDYLIAKGYGPDDIILFGDSAGGNLVLVSALRLMKERATAPAALILWSPWADLSAKGDSYAWLSDQDPLLCYPNILLPSVKAYAGERDLTHPELSPVFADYPEGFPPCLIQAGTRDILLSGFIQLYQKMNVNGNKAELDLYEGLPHDFQVQLPDTPESLAAFKRVQNFLNQYLF